MRNPLQFLSNIFEPQLSFFLQKPAEISQDEHKSASFYSVESKDAKCKKLLEKKDVEVEAMKKKLKDQERERQSELLKLQMEVN